MTGLILKGVVLLSSIVILRFAEPAINLMSHRGTPFLIRLAFWLMAIGAAAQILFLCCSAVPDWRSALISLGVALLLIVERRKEKRHA